MTRPAALSLLLAFTLACGKYGPPVRAGQARAEKPAPRLEVPLPAPPAADPRDVEPSGTAPETAPQPELEEEPPPEGAP